MNRKIASVSEQVGPQEAWQAKVENLEDWVRELLLKNQALRMALLTERARVQSGGHSLDLTADSLIG
jgi:hypothetical protein